MKSRKTLKKILPALVLLQIAAPLLAGYYDQGRKYYIYKKYDKARENFLKATEKYDHGDSFYFLGEIEKLQGNFKESEEYFEKAITSRSTTKKYRKNAYWDLIVLAEQRGDYSKVISTCKQMWENLNDDGAKQKIESIINKRLWTDNTEAIGLYNRGIDLKKRGKTEEALSSFRESIRVAPSFLAPKFETAMIAYRKGDNSTAASCLDEIISRIPYYAEAHLILGDIYYSDRSFSRAVEHFDRALEYGFISKKTKYLIALKKAQCYYNQDNIEETINSANEAHRLSSGEAEPLVVLSAAYIKKKDYDRALETLNRANALEKDKPLILYQIGSIYYSRDDWRYLSYFDRLFDLVKDDETASYHRIIPILIKGHFEKKHYSRVIEIMGSLKDSSENYELTLIRARSYYYLKQYDTAVDYFQKLSLNNEDKLMLAAAYSRSGRAIMAKEIVQSLMYSGEYRSLALKDPVLSPIVREIEREKEEKEKLESERLEKERLEREKLEKERLERERIEKEKRERELREAEKAKTDKKPETENGRPASPSGNKPSDNSIKGE